MKLYELTAHELRDQLRCRHISAREITEAIFDRIDKVEKDIGAYVNLTKELAFKQAEEVDLALSRKESLSDLAGIPMALKDNICTKGILTTCSSKMLQNFISPYDATVTKKLYEARSILIGKTNMDEFSMGGSTENSAFKTTHNPWDLERVPGGSSGGSAAAVASGEAFFALGSDTGGSVRQPAAFCGIVGLKPTYGLVSRYGLIAYAPSLDCVGTLTKDVEDCALVLNAIADKDPLDMTSQRREKMDYKAALIPDIKGLKIGISEEYFGEGLDENVKKMIYEAIDTLKALGGEIIEVNLPHASYAVSAYYVIAPCEGSSSLARFDGVGYGYRTKEYKDLEDMVVKSRTEGFGSEVKKRILLGSYMLMGDQREKYYNKAQSARGLIQQDFERVFEKCDVFIAPTKPTSAPRFKEKMNDPKQMYLSDIYTVSANLSGIPSISIPCGFDKNLPIGLQIMSKHFNESMLLRVAYTFEQNTDFHRQRPKI